MASACDDAALRLSEGACDIKVVVVAVAWGGVILLRSSSEMLLIIDVPVLSEGSTITKRWPQHVILRVS